MKDLTKGAPVPLILTFTVPVLLGNLLQLLYNLADTRIVGSFLGEQALAAVGATNPLNNLLIGLLVGLTNGFAITTARRFGANDREGVRRSVGAIFVLAALTAVVLTAAGLAFLKPLLQLLNTPAGLLPTSMAYFRVIILGTAATMFYNVCATVLRAVGDSVTPLLFLMLSTALNVALDLLFVGPLGLGVQGAALATVLAQLISVLLCLLVMRRRFGDIWPRRADFQVGAQLAGQLFGAGVSMAMMYCLVNVGSVILQGVINTFGTDIIVAHTAARRLTELFMLAFSAFGVTMATYCSQNLGAHKPARIRRGLRATLFIAWGLCLVVVAVTYLFAPRLVYLVTGSQNPDIIGTAVWYLRIDTLFYWITAAISILRNALQGVGDRVTPLVSSGIELCGKIAVVLFLTPRLGYFGIILAEPLVWAVMVLPLAVQALREPRLRGADAEPAPAYQTKAA